MSYKVTTRYGYTRQNIFLNFSQHKYYETISISSLIKNTEQHLRDIEKTQEPLIIKDINKKHYVILTLREYNSLTETLHLLSTKANAIALYESVAQDQNSMLSKMNSTKKKRLETEGWKVSTTAEFLSLSPKEVARIEGKFGLSKVPKDLRKSKRVNKKPSKQPYSWPYTRCSVVSGTGNENRHCRCGLHSHRSR